MATQCSNCSEGETTNGRESAATCEPCDLGTYGDSSLLGTCNVCPAGKYQDGKGESDCKPCPTDTCGEDPRATSNTQCLACPADRTTGSATGANASTACLCRRTAHYQTADGGCSVCPTGANCSLRDGITAHHITAARGFWRRRAWLGPIEVNRPLHPQKQGV